MKIWFRYLFFKLAKLFFFLILSLFVLFVTVDLSIHGVKFFSSGKTTYLEVLFYYLHTFAKHLELFFSLSFLLSSLKTLLDLTQHQELVALQMSGLSKKKLLSPFFLFSCALALFCYVNSQWLSPDAQDAAYAFRLKQTKNPKKEKVFCLNLENNTELVFQKYEAESKELFDVYWIISPAEVWYMKHLEIETKPMQARFVDHLVRSKNGLFEKKESFKRKEFQDLKLDEEAKFEKFVPFENRPLFSLYTQALNGSSERGSLLSHFHYKIAMPLLPFFLLMALSPIAMRFSRNSAPFLLLSSSLFGFISFITLMDAMLILGENQVLHAFLAIWTPFMLLSILALPRFIKT